MFLILISRRFAFFKHLISAKPECSGGGGGIMELILRRDMGLVRDAEFGGNSAIWLFST